MDTGPLLYEVPEFRGMRRAPVAGTAGRFVVAGLAARLTRVTQGKRIFTL
jgi:hypothetical protein